MESRITHSTCISTKVARTLLACLFFLLLISTSVAATEYTIHPSLSNESGASVAGEEVRELEVKTMPYWMFFLWMISIQMTPATEILFSARFLSILGGYRIICGSDVLKNTNRNQIYGFVNSNPGTYPNEIIKETGLNRGVLEHHLKTLGDKNMVVSLKGSFS